MRYIPHTSLLLRDNNSNIHVCYTLYVYICFFLIFMESDICMQWIHMYMQSLQQKNFLSWVYILKTNCSVLGDQSFNTVVAWWHVIESFSGCILVLSIGLHVCTFSSNFRRQRKRWSAHYILPWVSKLHRDPRQRFSECCYLFNKHPKVSMAAYWQNQLGEMENEFRLESEFHSKKLFLAYD